MKVDCNRIMVRNDPKTGNWLCIVKDTCIPCEINTAYCAINDMLERQGTLANWDKWEVPNFRERTDT